MRLLRFLIIVSLLPLLGCEGGLFGRSDDPATAAGPRPAASTGAGGSADMESAKALYPLNPGDKLHISVWGEQALQQDVVVAPDGTVSFPLAGQVAAAGRTAGQLDNELTAKLKKFIPDPVVNVSVLEAAGNTVFVIGAVTHPGSYRSPQPLTVMQALSMAGGFTPFASKDDIKILHQQDGRTVSIPFDYDDVANGRKLETNITLGSGDVIVVPD